MSDELDQPPPPAPREIPAEGVPDALRAIVRDLQTQPLRYRWFGVWWWPIKAMLIRAGHGPLLGTVLGPATDPAAIATLPAEGLTPGVVLAEGLRHYQFCARFDRSPVWVDTPDGDRIHIYDPDVET